MRNLNDSLEHIQLLIDRIQNNFTNNISINKVNYDKLQTLSEQHDYVYGQALAHVYLAQYYQAQKNDSNYYFHLDKARSIAESKNFFDILIEYIKLEGLRNVNNCDEMTALSLYLNGLKIADETKNKEASAAFHIDIGRLFYRNNALEDSKKFYMRALEILETLSVREANFYRKIAHISLANIYCIEGELERAREHYDKNSKIKHDTSIFTIITSEIKVKILLLENKIDEARKGIDELISVLENSIDDEAMLEDLYFTLMEIAISMRDKEYATWCMNKINELYKNPHQNVALYIRKLNLQYGELIGRESDELYEDFYSTTRSVELAHRLSTAESFKNLIALHEADKERKQILDEQIDLRIEVDMDALTKIYNRRYISKQISKLLQDSLTLSLGYVMVDMDYFKDYNDFYGHPRGDTVLVEIAALLTNCLPDNAYAARYGGDEFACLFVNKSESDIVSFIRKAQETLAEKAIEHLKSKSSQHLTLTFGIYNETNLEECSEGKLVKRADEALYEAKREGRNTFVIYSEKRRME